MRRFAGLGDQVAASLDGGDAILDGEVIAPDDEGRPQFYELLRHAWAPAYMAFDLMWLNGIDLRALSLTERRRRRRGILPKKSVIVSEALSVTGKGHRLFDLVRGHDLEGTVAKRLQDSYGTRVRWLKIKNRDYSQAEGRRELSSRTADRS